MFLFFFCLRRLNFDSLCHARRQVECKRYWVTSLGTLGETEGEGGEEDGEGEGRATEAKTIYPFHCPRISNIVNPLSPGIKLQILLLCFHTFLTGVVGRSC